MKYAINFLVHMRNNLKQGQPKENYFRMVDILDRRTKQILEEFNFDPTNVRYYKLRPSVDERQSQYAIEQAAAKKYPVILMPLALDVIMKDIDKRVKQDLLLFAKDFSFEHDAFYCRICTSSFGMNFSSHNRASREEAMQERLRDMKTEGYIIGRQGNNLSLKDCDTNRHLIKKYVSSKLRGTVVRFLSYRDELDYIECRIPVTNDMLAIRIEEKPKTEPSTTLSADDIENLKDTIAHYISSLQDFDNFEDKNLLLRLFRSYMSEIEEIFDYDGEIRRGLEEEHRKEREGNYLLSNQKEEKGREVAKQLGDSFSDLYNVVYKALNYQVHRIGFSLHKLSFQQHEAIQIELFSTRLPHRTELPVELDGIFDLNDDRTFYVYDTPKNVGRIEEFFHSFASQIEVEEYTVKNQRAKFIWKITARIRPIDLKTLLESVEGIDLKKIY